MFGLIQLLRVQSASSQYSSGRGVAGWISGLLNMQGPFSDYQVIQRNQMIYRPVYALAFGTLILSAPFSLMPLRKLLGNPVTKFLGGISMNYYLIHQTVIVHMKRIGFPASVSDTPNVVGEQPWQNQYTWFAFGISLVLAVLVTYLIEKPAARLLNRLRANRRRLPVADDSSRWGLERTEIEPMALSQRKTGGSPGQPTETEQRRL